MECCRAGGGSGDGAYKRINFGDKGKKQEGDRQEVIQVRETNPEDRESIPNLRETISEHREIISEVRETFSEVREKTPVNRETIPEIPLLYFLYNEISH
jgi:hypothetical protein